MWSSVVETVASIFEVIRVNEAAHLIAVVNESLRSVLQNAYRLIGLVVCLADVLSYDDMATRERLALRAFFQKHNCKTCYHNQTKMSQKFLHHYLGN